MKGISTILATILLVIIVVAIVGLVYTFSVTLFQQATGGAVNQTQQTISSFGEQVRIETVSAPTVYIRNVGPQTVNVTNIGVFLNDNKADFVTDTPLLSPGKIGTVSITDYVNVGDKVKIVSGGSTVTTVMNDPCSSAVLCLKFDEGSGNIAKDSGGQTGNNGVFNGESFSDGTLNGGFSRTSGRFGNAIKLDGMSAYVNLTNKSAANTASVTVAFWLNLAAPADCDVASNNWRSLIRKGTTSGAATGWDVVLEETGPLTSGLQWDIGNGTAGGNRLSASAALNVGDWNYLTFTYDMTTGDQRIYKNATSIASRTVSLGTMQPNINDVLISNGANAVPCPVGSGFVNGTVDEVRIFNRSLSQSEIQAEMGSSVPVSKTVASYSFEESGQVVNDTHIWVKGFSNNALSFDGFDDYVEVADLDSLDITDEITIQALVNYGNVGGTALVHKWVAPSSYVLEDNPPRMTVQTGSGFATCGALSALSINTWHNIVGTYSSTTGKLKIFTDGTLAPTCLWSGKININTGPLRIGVRSDSFSQFFNGTIDEVRIYNRAIY